MTDNNVVPTEIKLHKQSKLLEVSFPDDVKFQFTCEFLRVHSPSAEVRGHGPGQEVLQLGKEDVEITEIQAVGSYGIKPIFSDGHSTGIYSWGTLYELGEQQEQLWQNYLQRLADAGHTRKVH